MKRSGESTCGIQADKQKKTILEMENQDTAMDSLIKDAECIVCLDIPRGNVNGCKNGHILCHSCETKLRSDNHGHIFNCPTCKIPYTPCRQIFLAKFIAVYYKNSTLRCRHLNCLFMDLMERLSLHEDFCHHRINFLIHFFFSSIIQKFKDVFPIEIINHVIAKEAVDNVPATKRCEESPAFGGGSQSILGVQTSSWSEETNHSSCSRTSFVPSYARNDS